MKGTSLIRAVVGLAILLGGACIAAAEDPPPLTKERMQEASDLYFNRCAGCHGMLRKGATGVPLTTDRTTVLGTEYLSTIMTSGTAGGMPDFGESGVLAKEQIDLVAAFLLHEPPQPPEMDLEQMKKSLIVHIPPAKRPTEPMHKRDWQNFMGVVLRDVGKIAIIDGDTKELVNIVDAGFAVHIVRTSASGRYFYSIGRDGKVSLIDLWMEKPDKVAEVKVGYDARSVETSKYNGPKGDFVDELAIVGCYWPPSFVILDGQTLEPRKIVCTSGYTVDTNEYLREARVASILASHTDPLWVVNVKETGQIWLVNYSDIKNLDISIIDAERFLHDGGWDSTKRYFLVAANMRDKVAVIDTVEKRLEALVETGIKPHPGRGANLNHIEYGPLWCTGHLGDATVACIGVDKRTHPQNAWKVVKKINLTGEGGGNLFVKTHPKSHWLLADRPMNPDAKLQRSFDVIDKRSLEVVKSIEIPAKYQGKALHFEYNKDGTEFWVSVWGKKDQPTAMLVYDDHTLALKNELNGDWVRTPTGHFNVYNTTHDVY